MSQVIIVVDKISDWANYYPSDRVVTAQQYLTEYGADRYEHAQVINLCSSYRYLSTGYYCSLIAEARDHRVVPSVSTISDLSRKALYTLALDRLDQELDKWMLELAGDAAEFDCMIYFGQTVHSQLSNLARQTFEQLPCPILELSFRKRKKWELERIRPGSFSELEDVEQDAFANSLDTYARKLWRKPSARRTYRYDLAILIDPEEKMPPSNKTALKNIVRAGRRLGVDVDFITRKDYSRLAEYDGLFIRETTAVNHHTYRFAKKAEREGMVVMDDPTSILRCCNKVYLAELLQQAGVPTPKTHFLFRDQDDALEAFIQQTEYPVVLKIPDGSFSLGVTKAETEQALRDKLADFFKQSYLVLAQEFFYTEFDWRIGILNHRPLFACQYFMSKGHWQIYNHSGGKTNAGKFATMPTHQVPPKVLRAALKSTKLIGDGLYGVDIKQQGDRIAVIEVNDNPNIDAGVEDDYLQEDLYRQVMEVFLQRMERKRLGV